MAKLVTFVYVMIYFLSQFLVTKGGKKFFIMFKLYSLLLM